jgi:hypothetical protein
MVANPALLEPDSFELDDQALAYAARRATAVPVPAARRAAGAGPSPDAAGGAALLDYAAFVLEQEAEYCQQ